MHVARYREQSRELRLSGCRMVICPVVVRCSPPSCERLFRPPRVSDEGATGESGSLIFYSGKALEIAEY